MRLACKFTSRLACLFSGPANDALQRDAGANQHCADPGMLTNGTHSMYTEWPLCIVACPAMSTPWLYTQPAAHAHNELGATRRMLTGSTKASALAEASIKSACRIQRPAAMPAKLFTDRTKEGSTTWLIPGFHLPHQHVMAQRSMCLLNMQASQKAPKKLLCKSANSQSARARTQADYQFHKSLHFSMS